MLHNGPVPGRSILLFVALLLLIAALASVIVDLRLTQVVNKTWGVHAVLPVDRVRRGGQPVVMRER